MPDSLPTPTPTPFRVAFCAEGRSTNLQWVHEDHPATLLLDIANPASLPACWKWLSEFDLQDVMLHRRGHPRRITNTTDITMSQLTLISNTGDEILVCSKPGRALAAEDLAVLGGICLLACGGLGTTLEAVAEGAREQLKEDAVEARVQADKDVAGPLVAGLIQAIMPTAARVNLAPARFDGGPADLNIGTLSFRVYDRESFAFAGVLAKMATAMQTSLRTLTGSGSTAAGRL